MSYAPTDTAAKLDKQPIVKQNKLPICGRDISNVAGLIPKLFTSKHIAMLLNYVHIVNMVIDCCLMDLGCDVL